MTESETKVEDEVLRQAVNQLSQEDLWASERKQLLFAVSPSLIERPWRVDMALNERRYVESRKRMVSWVRERPMRGTFQKATYDELSASASDVSRLLNEYDDLKWSPDSVLRYVDAKKIEWYDDPTPAQREALDKLWKIGAALDAQGINVSVRDDLIDLLSEFEFAFRTIQMTPEPLDSADCTILQPVATYLATPELQSSFLNRYFALCLLKCLREEAEQKAHIPSVLKKLSLGGNASGILTRLLAQFGDLGNLASPSTVDGRELKAELREAHRLGIGVPSLLFSLFEIIVPGR